MARQTRRVLSLLGAASLSLAGCLGLAGDFQIGSDTGDASVDGSLSSTGADSNVASMDDGRAHPRDGAEEAEGGHLDGALGHDAHPTDAPAEGDAGPEADMRVDAPVSICDPARCAEGCCDDAGLCQAGTQPSACGAAGAACAACGAGQSCMGGQCACGASCTTGCCTADGSCVPSTEGHCGSPGMACAACAPGQTCDKTGACTCNAASCPAGCCTAAGACVALGAQTATSCGAAGALCSSCATGQKCDTTTGQCVCNAGSCPQGCCTSDGTCAALPASSHLPGDPCSASNSCTGTYTCTSSSPARVACNAPAALNRCGGCQPLSPAVGTACATRCGGGTYVCPGGDAGKDSVVCDAPVVDRCGGCTMAGGTSTGCLTPPRTCELGPGTCVGTMLCAFTSRCDAQ